MSEKWMPEVGQECEITSVENAGDQSWCRVKIVHIGSTKITLEALTNTVDALKGDCTVKRIESVKFRPITREVDKYRDEQIENMTAAYYGDLAMMPADGDIHIQWQYNAGCRILTPDERIVKPLIDEQISRIAFTLNLSRQSVERFYVAVQRELGVID